MGERKIYQLNKRNIMNTEMKIKRHILMSMLTEKQIDECDWIDLSTEEGVSQAWDVAEGYDDIFADTEIIDDEEEFRCSGESTDLTCSRYNRHYESEQVAMKLACGTFVSWTYWSGGVKHGEPDAVDWIEDAYEVDCKEERKLIVVRTYMALNND